MSPSGADTRTDETVRQEAIAWLAKIRGPDADHGAFQDWYMADPRHADIYDDVLKNWEAMAVAAGTPAAQASRNSTRGLPPRLAVWAALAAAFAAVLLLSSGNVVERMGPGATERYAPTQFASRVGEIRNISLPDGSEVTLDTDSKFTLRYTKNERRLRLDSGRARFRVAHGDSRLFLVEAGNATVVAHGTVFDVDLGGPRLQVSLLEGSVEVRQAPLGTTPACSVPVVVEPKRLKPGQRLVIAERASPHSIEAEELRWASGLLSFEDAELGDVVAAANRYNKTQIQLADALLAKRRFSGTFNPRKPLALSETLASMFELAITRDGDGAIRLAPSTGSEK